MSKSKKTASSKELLHIRRHIRFGWCSLLVFVTLGLALEAMHGFKIGWYLDVSNETRRLMWTLAHAHGTLLALVNLAFASTMKLLPADAVRAASGGSSGPASPCPRDFFSVVG